MDNCVTKAAWTVAVVSLVHVTRCCGSGACASRTGLAEVVEVNGTTNGREQRSEGGGACDPIR